MAACNPRAAGDARRKEGDRESRSSDDPGCERFSHLGLCTIESHLKSRGARSQVRITRHHSDSTPQVARPAAPTEEGWFPQPAAALGTFLVLPRLSGR